MSISKTVPFRVCLKSPLSIQKNEWIKNSWGELIQVTSISKVEFISNRQIAIIGRGKRYENTNS